MNNIERIETSADIKLWFDKPERGLGVAMHVRHNARDMEATSPTMYLKNNLAGSLMLDADALRSEMRYVSFNPKHLVASLKTGPEKRNGLDPITGMLSSHYLQRGHRLQSRLLLPWADPKVSNQSMPPLLPRKVGRDASYVALKTSASGSRACRKKHASYSWVDEELARASYLKTCG
ncbi:uncharacterized protein BCR38DRAFT_503464 [Pseudomassariella vexata]|uniref:Uncharacterized protein n=1 Tax=Pseudomassariella vexata TaxID=1141098 RepID=A0A1Y2EF49_9PEZI|nr:uncharacterized protein BCR38DRAFT_503464 [Pseudomassariella vexata]ORY70203.1 hypothetical protein BCR38DRAFT_503464 [Pseudomassariella vexata]